MHRSPELGATPRVRGKVSMRVGVLGDVVVWDHNGLALPLAQQLQRLLGLLVAAGGGVVPNDWLADHITDGRAESSAVRTAISRLRRVLPDRVETTRGGYRLRLAPGDLDADHFTTLVDLASRAAAAERQHLLIDALDVWRGPAFGHLRDEPWAIGIVRRLDEIRATASEDLANGFIAEGRRAEAINLLGDVVRTHPYRERPVILLVRQLADDGRVVEALREIQRLRASLADVGLELSGDARSAEVDLLAGDIEDAHDPRSIEEVIGNLHSPADQFIGRERELKTLVETVESNRLVTLVGAGGVGKTRLATTAAAACSASFAAGVWFVQLVAASDEAEVVDAVMSVLHATTDARQSPIGSIIEQLRGRATLVVLDNAEHVIEGCATLVAALLRGTEDLHLIVTSREPLGILGERVHAVPPLDSVDSVEMFCARAREADDGFDCSDDDRAIIASICQRVDGLPLAIELAAARTRALTVGELHERLGDPTAMPRRGDAATHHATMSATIEWSYRLLTDDERLIFDAIGVFAGSFDLAAVAHICEARSGGPPGSDVIVQSLVNKSMVVADRSGRTTRYALLETIRRFALDRLADDSGNDGLRARFATHFTDLANTVTHLRPTDPDRARAITTLDWDNFRDALQHQLQVGDVDAAASLTANLAIALDLGRHEHAQWVRSVLEVLPDDHRLSPLLHCFAGWWANLFGDHRLAVRHAERGLQCSPTTRRHTAVLLHIVLAEARIHLGDPIAALDAAAAVLELGEDDHQIRIVFVLACWAAWVPRPELVSGLARRIEVVAERTGQYDDLHQAAYCAGIAALIEGDPINALERFREARRQSAGYPNLEAEAAQGATLAAAAGNLPDADVTFLEALEATSDAHMLAHLWMVLETLAIHWADHDRLAHSAVLLGGLEAHDRSCVFLAPGRGRAQSLVAARADLSSCRDVGRSLSRAELTDHARALLLADTDQSSERG